MRGAILRGARRVEVEEVPDAAVEPGGVVIRVKACGICGSDLHPYRLGQNLGVVKGHEFSGDVVAVGEGVTDINLGDRVVGSGYRPCGECKWCREGKYYRCANAGYLGRHFNGAMADYVTIPYAQLGKNIHRLPGHISYEEAALVEPLAVASFSVRRAGIKEGETAAVIGAGIIGLGIVQVLKAAGASRVFISGRRERRLSAAVESGADFVFDAAMGNPVGPILEANGGNGVDVVFDCAGTAETFQQSAELVRGGGRVVMVALYENPILWDPYAAQKKNLTIIGLMGAHFPSAVELLASGKVNVKPFITHEFPLDEAQKAFETQERDPGAIKVLLIP